jgi:hypothetical protein
MLGFPLTVLTTEDQGNSDRAGIAGGQENDTNAREGIVRSSRPEVVFGLIANVIALCESSPETLPHAWVSPNRSNHSRHRAGIAGGQENDTNAREGIVRSSRPEVDHTKNDFHNHICGVGCVTATSRCTWAFARDGGIPGSGWWSTVNKTKGTSRQNAPAELPMAALKMAGVG